MVCPTCSEQGRDYTGPPAGELFHYLERLLWDAHKIRQNLERKGSDACAEAAVFLVKHIEYFSALLVQRRH